MFGDPQIFIFVTVFALALFWSVPPIAKLRAVLVIIVSAVLIFYAAPLALLAVILVTSTGYIGLRLALIQRSKQVAWFVVALIAVEFFAFQRISSSIGQADYYFVALLGLSYICFRTAAVVLDVKQYARSRSGAPTFLDMLLLNIFYPIVPSGPIERQTNISLDRLDAPFDRHLFIYGLMRAIVGIFVVKFVGDTVVLSRVQDMTPTYFGSDPGGSPWGAIVFCVLSLLYLYFNFSGFMSIAVGVGALFGLRLSENFNWPFSALNIQEFWKRWHITLGDFANKYMYFPLLKTFGGNPYAAIFVTFLIVGIWHQISWTFLVWGAAHGAALALHAWLAKADLLKSGSGVASRVLIGANWIATMFFVCWAWTFASAPNIEAALRMTGRLFGIGT